MNAKPDAGAQFRTILVPTDFSPTSRHALAYGAALARRFESEMHVAFVYEPDFAYAVPALLDMPRFTTPEQAEERSLAHLRELANEHALQGTVPKIHAPRGRAFDQICKLAGKISADLIVIGTRGNTGLKHVFLGSTAERVVRHAPCPVLVVRGAEENAPDPQIRSILVPVDFSECARHGLNYAVALAQSTGARLILLHALKLLPIVPGDRFALEATPSVDMLEKAAADAMTEFVARSDFKGVPYETKIECGHPAQGICDFAEQCGVDLIVTSTHGATGIAHVLIGSVAEHVVRYARCPVLVVRRSAESR